MVNINLTNKYCQPFGTVGLKGQDDALLDMSCALRFFTPRVVEISATRIVLELIRADCRFVYEGPASEMDALVQMVRWYAYATLKCSDKVFRTLHYQPSQQNIPLPEFSEN